MGADHRKSAAELRTQLERGVNDPFRFRAALLSVPPIDRDAWVNDVLGLHELPDDGPDLPRDCVPYLPCAVDALLQLVTHVPVKASDVFVDVGSGVGRAAAVVHLLTGARTIGLEIQPHLVATARALANHLRLTGISYLEGDAVELTASITSGTIFFLYCPFGGERLELLLRELEPLSKIRTIRLCCVNLPLPSCAWLQLEHTLEDDVVIYRSAATECPSGREP